MQYKKTSDIIILGFKKKPLCGCGGMADAQDSKSCVGDYVWVQVPPSAVCESGRTAALFM